MICKSTNYICYTELWRHQAIELSFQLKSALRSRLSHPKISNAIYKNDLKQSLFCSDNTYSDTAAI